MQIAPESLIDSFSRKISRRFKAESARTLFANTVSKEPIVISNVVVSAPTGEWTEPPPLENGFVVSLLLKPLPKFEIRTSERHINFGPVQAGDLCLLDLSTAPTSPIKEPLESVRIQINQRTLDDLAYDHELRSSRGLRPTFGVRDEVLLGLSSAILRQSEVYGGQNELFLGHVGLALFVHLVQVYGQIRSDAPSRGGLAPWQFQRARDLMYAKLSEGVTIAELAEACGLSVSYFARAFRMSAGMPAHKWLLKARIERAKGLLLDSSMELSEIALECGFVDQSHFTKVFSLREGQAPGRWRRLRLN